jgi:hypothetical protein
MNNIVTFSAHSNQFAIELKRDIPVGKMVGIIRFTLFANHTNWISI